MQQRIFARAFAAKPTLCIPIGIVDCSQGLNARDTPGLESNHSSHPEGMAETGT
jgi:hypothetical protein